MTKLDTNDSDESQDHSPEVYAVLRSMETQAALHLLVMSEIAELKAMVRAMMEVGETYFVKAGGDLSEIQAKFEGALSANQVLYEKLAKERVEKVLRDIYPGFFDKSE